MLELREVKPGRSAIALAACALIAPLSSAGPLNPPGPPAPTMKTLVEVEPRIAVEGLPGSATALHVIAEPGSYVLTGNLVGEEGKNGIQIEADDVTLDLAGFTLFGASGGSGVAAPEPRQNAVVKNGVLRGWGMHGLQLQDCDGCRAEGLLVEGTGGDGSYSSIFLGPRAQVLNCIARGNPAWTGIQVRDGSRVESCSARDNGRGYELSGENNTIVRSSAVNNGGEGIYIQGAGIVAENVVQGSGVAILTGGRALIVDNTAWANGVGVEIAGERALVEGNHLSSCWNVGIRVGDGQAGSVVRRNQVIESSVGIDTAASAINLVTGNAASGNALGDFVGGGACGEMLDLRGGMTVTGGSPWGNVSY